MIMDKNAQKITWIVGTIVGVGVLSYYLFRSPKQKQPEVKKEVSQTPPERIHSESKVSKSSRLQKIKPETRKAQPEEYHIFPLRKGSTGKEVERLQIWLLRNYGWKGAVTAIYDEQTLKLVRKCLKKDTVDQMTYEKHQMGIPIHQQIHT